MDLNEMRKRFQEQKAQKQSINDCQTPTATAQTPAEDTDATRSSVSRQEEREHRASTSNTRSYNVKKTFRLADGSTYVGTVDTNGKFFGKGVRTYQDGSVYDGLWENGLRNGEGTMTWADGSKYIGNWKNDQCNGTGTMTWPNGEKYQGRWRDNHITKGKYTYANGDYYDGEFNANWKREGNGTYYWRDGLQHWGTWKNDKRHGKGEIREDYCTFLLKGEWHHDQFKSPGIIFGQALQNMLFPMLQERNTANSVLNEIKSQKQPNDEGNYVGTRDAQGKFSGKGVYTYPNGSVYDGLWENGLRNGVGTMTWPDGSKYIGNWKNNLRHGTGTLIWANGKQYNGRWKNDNIFIGENDRNNGSHAKLIVPALPENSTAASNSQDGKQTIHYDDGSTYVGTLDTNGKFSGKGVYTYPDGSVYDGLWENGLRSGSGKMMWTDGSQYVGNWKNDKQHGNGTMTWANGKQFSGRWHHGSFI